jgi:hypothetical protein
MSLKLQTFYKLNTPPRAILDNATKLSRMGSSGDAQLKCMRHSYMQSVFHKGSVLDVVEYCEILTDRQRNDCIVNIYGEE